MNTYLVALQHVVGCVGFSAVHVRAATAGNGFDLRITPNEGLALRAGTPLTLLARELVDPSTADASGVHVYRVAYDYEVLNARTGRSLFSYHLHAVGPSPVTWPHLHPGGGWASDLPRASRTHLPTGLVPFSQLVRTLILDFGVRPRRPGWERALADAAEEIEDLS